MCDCTMTAKDQQPRNPQLGKRIIYCVGHAIVYILPLGDGTICLAQDNQKAAVLKGKETIFEIPVFSCIYSMATDNKGIIAIGNGSGILFIDAKSGKTLADIEMKTPVHHIEHSSGDEFIAIDCKGQMMKVHARQKSPIEKLESHRKEDKPYWNNNLISLPLDWFRAYCGHLAHVVMQPISPVPNTFSLALQPYEYPYSLTCDRRYLRVFHAGRPKLAGMLTLDSDILAIAVDRKVRIGGLGGEVMTPLCGDLVFYAGIDNGELYEITIEG